MKELSSEDYNNRLNLLIAKGDEVGAKEFMQQYCAVDKYVDPIFKDMVAIKDNNSLPDPPRNMNIVL